MIAFIYLIKILIIIVPLLISVAYFTLAERKILGAIQRRRGPNVVGVYGLLQPLSDGLKLFVKESLFPSSGDRFLFLISPLLTFIVSLLGYAIIPFNEYSLLVELDAGFLYLFAVSSLGVYGVILSGWSSNSKYAFLGALRSTAQMISYEVSIGFILLTCILCCGSLDLQVVIASQQEIWFVFPFFPLFIIFFISALAETNRHPFDLPEAEAELVSGYNVEYSAMGFALFSLGEYANMLMMSSINTILFFGGWLSPSLYFYFLPGSFWFGVKISFFVILFIWMRAALPRYRYDQLMNLGWKIFLPISLTYLVLVACILLSVNSLPF
jgi:NADH-quinone oxidoreductase subunit H